MLGKKKRVNFIPVDHKVKYPKWSIVYANDSKKYYLILDKSRMPFISERAVRSWGRPYLIGSEKTLSGYSKWKCVGFAPGSVLTSMQGSMYYISGKSPIDVERLLIATPDFFEVLGFNQDFSFVVSDDELDFHPSGGAINNVSI